MIFQKYSLILQIQESPLRTVQLKILHFLGSLGGQTNACLLETSTDEIAREAVAWDTQPRLQFAVPFVDMKPNINLGKSTLEGHSVSLVLKIFEKENLGFCSFE